MLPSPAGSRQVFKKIGPSKILNQDSSMTIMAKSSQKKDIFNRIRSTRLGFGQLGGRLPAISGLLKKWNENDALKVPKMITKGDLGIT